MCLLSIAVDRKLTEEEFTNGFNGNKDGCGISWISKNDKVCYKKGIMNLKEAWDFYNKKVNLLPHVVHFRMTSAGKTVPELTHPFIIGRGELPLDYEGDENVLFQNGTLSGWRDIYLSLIAAGKKIQLPISDTYVMSQLVGQALANDNELDEILSSGGKWAMVTPEGVTRWGDFTEEKGVFFSNQGYKSFRSYSSYGYTDWDKWDKIPAMGDVVTYDSKKDSEYMSFYKVKSVVWVGAEKYFRVVACDITGKALDPKQLEFKMVAKYLRKITTEDRIAYYKNKNKKDGEGTKKEVDQVTAVDLLGELDTLELDDTATPKDKDMWFEEDEWGYVMQYRKTDDGKVTLKYYGQVQEELEGKSRKVLVWDSVNGRSEEVLDVEIPELGGMYGY